MTKDFIEFRNELLKSFGEFRVPYKLFGGAAVCILNDKRETLDLDIMLEATDDSLEKFCKALDSIGFDKYDNLKEQIYDGLNNGYKLYPVKEEWKKYHIDLLFDLSIFDYNNLSSSQIEDRGIVINVVDYSDIIRMKNRVNPVDNGNGGIRYELRERDKDDIKFLADKLDLDPITGKPKKEKKICSFGGDNSD